MEAVVAPFTLVPSVMVSVAPLLVEALYVVASTDREATAPDDVAERPIFCKLVLALMALAMPEAIEVREAPDGTV